MATSDKWDDEDFEPPAVLKPVIDRWDGEDEDDVKDSWEDEEDDKAQSDEADGTAVQTKKKKPLRDRIAEKEAKRKEELEKKRKAEEDAMKEMSPEEAMAEKLRLQKIQEDADLELARESLGITNDELAGRTGIDGMNPTNKEEFQEFETALKDKIVHFEKSPHYVGFLEMLLRDISVNCDAEDLKRLGSTLTALANEKVKAQKSTKGKKKSKKATVNVGKGGNMGMEDEYQGYDEFDDFM